VAEEAEDVSDSLAADERDFEREKEMSEAEKRSVHTDALATLGTIIGEGEKRDAIHLAVEPAVAAERLKPGQDVGFVNGGFAATERNVGIVDPFLKKDVMAGERFWLLVYPRQITSLRHVWAHPDFPEAEYAVEEIETDSKSISERWIRDFAARVGLKYQVLMDGAKDYYETKRSGGWGEYLCFGGLLEDEYVPDEFWPHYEAVTGETVEAEFRGSFFTCSC
jgi:hypothetical protein